MVCILVVRSNFLVSIKHFIISDELIFPYREHLAATLNKLDPIERHTLNELLKLLHPAMIAQANNHFLHYEDFSNIVKRLICHDIEFSAAFVRSAGENDDISGDAERAAVAAAAALEVNVGILEGIRSYNSGLEFVNGEFVATRDTNIAPPYIPKPRKQGTLQATRTSVDFSAPSNGNPE